jgi:hypothetical protein
MSVFCSAFDRGITDPQIGVVMRSHLQEPHGVVFEIGADSTARPADSRPLGQRYRGPRYLTDAFFCLWLSKKCLLLVLVSLSCSYFVGFAGMQGQIRLL